jgi:hypothetical protein
MDTAQATSTETTAVAAEPEVVVAAGDTTGTGEQTQPESTPDNPAGDEVFLTAEEEAALRDKHRNDPEALSKSLRRAFHEKTTRLKAEREQIRSVMPLLQALHSDPQRAVRVLAAQYGINIAESTHTPDGRTEAQAATVDKLVTKFEEALGPDVAPGVVEAIRGEVRDLVKTLLQPVQQFHQTQVTQLAEERSRNTLDAFTEKYPDWKKLEGRMVELSKEMPASKGVDDMTYMTRLYRLAKEEKAPAVAAKAEVERTNAALHASGSPAKGTPESSVSTTPTKRVSFQEAAQAAIRQLSRG